MLTGCVHKKKRSQIETGHRLKLVTDNDLLKSGNNVMQMEEQVDVLDSNRVPADILFLFAPSSGLNLSGRQEDRREE